MAVATFDTLKFANTLKAAGVPPQQAEAQAAAFAEVIQLNLKDLVTKDDLATAAAGWAGVFKDVGKEIEEAGERLVSRIDSLAEYLRGEGIVFRWLFAVNTIAILGILVRLFVLSDGY